MTEEQVDSMDIERKEYTPPKLTVYGDVASLTQQNQGDSGCAPSTKDCGAGDGNSRLFHPLLS